MKTLIWALLIVLFLYYGALVFLVFNSWYSTRDIDELERLLRWAQVEARTRGLE